MEARDEIHSSHWAGPTQWWLNLPGSEPSYAALLYSVPPLIGHIQGVQCMVFRQRDYFTFHFYCVP